MTALRVSMLKISMPFFISISMPYMVHVRVLNLHRNEQRQDWDTDMLCTSTYLVVH